MSEFSTARRAAAWAVHTYTMLGLPLAAAQVWGIVNHRADVFFIAMWAGIIVDSTDGTMARKVKVREVVPSFDGRKLDDIVDFINFVFIPVLALPGLGLLTDNLAWVAMLPLFASSYGFCNERAKTEESFVGFPSYWNILILYLYVLHSPPWLTAVVVTILSVLVYVPLHYIYPTKAKLLKPVTLGLGVIWAAMLVPVCFVPDAPWARTVTWISFAYPVYYFVLSVVHHLKNAHHEHAVST